MPEARHNEIKHKLESTEVLAGFRRYTTEPDARLRVVNG
jgi:hypothetical protein